MTPQRTIPPYDADERATLTAFLDFQRATLAVKCDGLTGSQLRERAVPPSSLSLLGIVRHMAEVERNWFRPVLGGEPMATIFAPDLDWEAAFRDVATADVAEAFRVWQAECDHARASVVTSAASLARPPRGTTAATCQSRGRRRHASRADRATPPRQGSARNRG